MTQIPDLEWEKYEKSLYRAHTKYESGDYQIRLGSPGTFTLLFRGKLLNWYSSKDNAEAAANKHNRERDTLEEAIKKGLDALIAEAGKPQDEWRSLHPNRSEVEHKNAAILLMHTELSEIVEGIRRNLMDKHLPQYPQEHVEAADLLIRLAGYCHSYGIDLGKIVNEKMKYNKTRPDHKLDNRMKKNGKKY